MQKKHCGQARPCFSIGSDWDPAAPRLKNNVFRSIRSGKIYLTVCKVFRITRYGKIYPTVQNVFGYRVNCSLLLAPCRFFLGKGFNACIV